MSDKTTFDSEGKAVPAVIASELDSDGNVVVFAQEGDSDSVKAFTAKKAPVGHIAEYVQA